jgi:preprotein translocase SecF subunit
MPIFKNPNFDFLAWRWPAVSLSCLIITAGAVTAALQGGLALGIDFSGGTIVIVQFDGPVTEDTVRDAVGGAAGESVVQQYGDAEANEIMIRLPQGGAEEGASLEEGANAVVAALEQSSIGGFTVIGQELVGPVIGQELQRRGVNAFVFAMLGILVYVALRFRFSFAVGAIIAVVHDILVTLSLLTFFGFDLSLNVVAAMLTITGYSVNDSIVVFDRVRENLNAKGGRRQDPVALVNRSINETLPRTVLTSGTTLVVLLALLIFGGAVIRDFTTVLILGVLVGTYSSIFVASPALLEIQKRWGTRELVKTKGRGRTGPPVSKIPPRRRPTGKKKRRKKKGRRAAGVPA